MTTRYLYSELASLVDARKRCGESNMKDGASEWFDKHTDRINALVSEHMPSGSGFDNGTTLDLERSHADKLVFNTAFHHMDDVGMYDGWTEHTITVVPSLTSGFHLRVSGRDRNDIKDYIGESFHEALKTDLTDQLGFERLSAKLGDQALTFRERWLNHCHRVWDVIGADGQPLGSEPARGYSSWLEARKQANKIMEGMEVQANG